MFCVYGRFLVFSSPSVMKARWGFPTGTLRGTQKRHLRPDARRTETRPALPVPFRGYTQVGGKLALAVWSFRKGTSTAADGSAGCASWAGGPVVYCGKKHPDFPAGMLWMAVCPRRFITFRSGLRNDVHPDVRRVVARFVQRLEKACQPGPLVRGREVEGTVADVLVQFFVPVVHTGGLLRTM